MFANFSDSFQMDYHCGGRQSAVGDWLRQRGTGLTEGNLLFNPQFI